MTIFYEKLKWEEFYNQQIAHTISTKELSEFEVGILSESHLPSAYLWHKKCRLKEIQDVDIDIDNVFVMFFGLTLNIIIGLFIYQYGAQMINNGLIMAVFSIYLLIAISQPKLLYSFLFPFLLLFRLYQYIQWCYISSNTKISLANQLNKKYSLPNSNCIYLVDMYFSHTNIDRLNRDWQIVQTVFMLSESISSNQELYKRYSLFSKTIKRTIEYLKRNDSTSSKFSYQACFENAFKDIIPLHETRIFNKILILDNEKITNSSVQNQIAPDIKFQLALSY